MDRRLLLRASMLLAWAAFFAWLWGSGEMVRYLGPRTYWVIPFGTLVLTGAGLAQLAMLRGRPARSLTRPDLTATVAVLAPLLLLVAVPAPDLGALAASRKASFEGGGGPALIVPGTADDGELGFIDFYYANRSSEYALNAGVVPGEEVELLGFVSESDGERVKLTRFYISCCAADAVPYSADVLVAHSGGFSENQWLDVRGTVVTDERGNYAVEAVSARPVAEPKDPYL